MKGLLFLNGTPPKEQTLRRIAARKAREGDALQVYCTDGAYRYLAPVLKPDTVVGDFDSLCKGEVDPRVRVLSFPPEKDFTDGLLAVHTMTDNGINDIDIFGGYGGRPDMAESNFFLPVLALKKGGKARLRGSMTTYAVDGVFSATVKKGATVSVVPFTDEVHIVYMKGLKYTLTDYRMHKFATLERPDYIMGVSNESLGGRVEIALSSGVALVFVQEDDDA